MSVKNTIRGLLPNEKVFVILLGIAAEKLARQ